MALKTKSARDLERAYRGLGNAYKRQGNLVEAAASFEKRLTAAEELDSNEAKASCLAELGNLYLLLGEVDRAVSYLESLMSLAR